ncbi:hypothetical protein PFISCL1PPCAC_15310, partial [Pristionchus fissidentatus]
NFNALQLESLKRDGILVKPILPASVRKRTTMFKNITPFHTAAINPDSSLLASLRDIDPLMNVPDQNNWYTTHYAAVCEGDGPLKFLLSNDVGVCDVNKEGEMPLLVAARVGREENVKILLEAMMKMEKLDEIKKSGKKEKKTNEKEEESELDHDEGPAAKRIKKAKKENGDKKSIVNGKNRKGWTALHAAVWNGRTECVRVLLSCPSIDIECTTGASEKKMTPLMMATGKGHLEIAMMLIDRGAKIEGRDKLKRSPLMIACINGQSDLAEILLHKGADVQRVAKSTLSEKNEWMMTPLSIAYLKGHFSIVSWLLDNYSSDVDVNAKDQSGITLISSLLSFCDGNNTANLPCQINYLIQRGSDCSLVDATGNSPLHTLAAVKILMRG